MATPINTVPLGQSGTGSAFVLGESQAANQLLNTIANNRKVAQQQELLKEQQARQTATNWQKNQLKVDGGLYWQPEFNKRYQGHLEKGIQLKQMGVDPYNFNPNDPNQAALAEDYLLERQGILADVDTRKALETNVGKQMGLVKGNPSNYYASDIAALNKYIETPFSEASQMQPPTLTERFKPNTVLQKITPAQVGSDIVIGNKRIKSVKALVPETRSALISGYENDPASQRWVDELTGGQGFTIPMLERIPASKEAIQTDLKTQYDGNPDLRTQLAAQGIIGSDSKEFKDYVTAESDKLSSAKSKWESQIQSDLAQILPKVKQMESNLPDYASSREARAAQSAAQTKSRYNAWWDDLQKEKKGDLFIENAVAGTPSAIAQLNANLSEINGSARKVRKEEMMINGKRRSVVDATVITYPTVVKQYQKNKKTGKDDHSLPKIDVEMIVRKIIPSKTGRNGEIELNGILNKLKSYGAEKTSKRLPYENEPAGWINDDEE